MKCPKCQFENPEGIIFCGKCASKLEFICPNCNFSNPPDFIFCGKCASDLSTPSGAPSKDFSFDEKLTKIQKYLPKGIAEKIVAQRDRIEGERKQVTVMFCDMEGFTGLSEKIDPEEVYSIMDQIYELLIHKVHDYEGTVNEMTGDGIMALFGAPIALEDAPQRAIRSAHAIHMEMSRFNDRMKQEKEGLAQLKMRIGIHTGPVVVGTLGNDLRVEFKAVGDTVNLASRMEGLAEPGATYVTAETFKLTEGFFRFEALGEKEIKGKAAPVKIFRVIAPSTRRTRFDVSAERGLTAFIGRERELELLLDGFERSKEGRGQAFSIMAEAGVGKSRLLYEFRKAVANEDVTFLEGKCLSYSRGVAYHPVLDVLKSNFEIQEGDADAEITEKVKTGLRAIGADEPSTLPYLLELLSVKNSGIDNIPMSPEARKDRITGAVKLITFRGSEIRPLIIAIEDIHWIDKSSEDYLKDLLDSISGARVFLIFTYRPEYMHTWGARSYHSQVNLNRLSNRESLVMVSHLLDAVEIHGDLEDFILEKTEGVPFFIEEFIKSLKDLQVIEKRDNVYGIAKDIETVTIPSTIHDVIMARVDSLPEEAKGVLQTGSVVGREFGYDLIKRVTDLSDQELLSYLSTLKDSELLYERGIYPKSIYVFKHALTQEGVYQSLLKKTRQKYHRDIAQVLEKHFSEETEILPELGGHHFTEAGIIEQAIPYWQRAGEIAIRRSANIEAVDHITKAIELVKMLPDTPERTRQELTLQIALGVPLQVTKGPGAVEVGDAYTRARQLCRQMGQPQPSQLFPALWGLWRFYRSQAKFQTARELADEFLNLAQQQSDPALVLQGHHAQWTTLLNFGELAAAQAHTEKGIALYSPKRHHSDASLYSGHDLGVCARTTAAFALWSLGFPDQALDKANDALSLAQKLSHPPSLVIALEGLAGLHRFRREVQAAQVRAEASIALATEQGSDYDVATGNVIRGWALVEQKQAEDGLTQIRKGLSSRRPRGTGLEDNHMLGLLAEAYGKAGQVEEGLNVLDKVLATLDKTGQRFWEPELYRLKGELLLRRNEGEIETSFHYAIEIARRQRAKSLQLRAVMSLSRFLQSQDKTEEARLMLAETYGWFTEGFDTPDLKEAKSMLEKLM